MAFEDDLLRDAEDDLRTVAYIKNCLPQEVREKFSDDTLFYFLDVLGDYYVDLLDKVGDAEDVDIDVLEVADYVVRQARKDKMGEFLPEDVRWVVDAELDYGEQLED